MELQPGNRSPFVLSALPDLVEPEINYRRTVQSEDSGNDKPSDDGDAKRLPQFTANAHSDCERQRAKHRRNCRHHDRTKANKACLIN